jgi:hypothetical protein
VRKGDKDVLIALVVGEASPTQRLGGMYLALGSH